MHVPVRIHLQRTYLSMYNVRRTNIILLSIRVLYAVQAAARWALLKKYKRCSIHNFPSRSTMNHALKVFESSMIRSLMRRLTCVEFNYSRKL